MPITPGALHAKRPAFGYVGLEAPGTVVWRQDFGDYASAAALLAAWAEEDVANKVTWELDGTHVQTSAGPTPHVAVPAVASGPFGLPYTSTLRRTLGGFTPGRAYLYAVDIYGVGAASAPPRDIWSLYQHEPVIANGAGELTASLRFWYASNGGLTVPPTEFWYDNVRVETTAWRPTAATEAALLRLGYPLDEALSAPRLRAGSRLGTATTGDGYAWKVGGTVEHLLRGLARWIPRSSGTTREGHPVSGWDDAWTPFLQRVWSGAPVLFYPDADDLTQYVPVRVLAPRPRAGQPPCALEADGSRHVAIELVADVPFDGY